MRHVNVGRYQLIWWGHMDWRWAGVCRWPDSLAHIYDWGVYAGPVEVRRFSRHTPSERGTGEGE